MEKLNFISKLIKNGSIVCLPTDTQYGLIGDALNLNAINEVYDLKKRNRKKPLIVLFDSLDSIEFYGVIIPKRFRDYLRRIYPAALTVILNVKQSSPFRDLFGHKIAVRVPDDAFLRNLIKETNPLFAPSANPEGMEPAKSCDECRAYFDGEVAYCMEGKCSKLPSTIVDLSLNKPRLVRKGIVECKL